MQSNKEFVVLVLNPGSTSTKVGVFRNDTCVAERTVRHSARDLETYEKVWDQYEFRKRDILAVVKAAKVDLSQAHAIVGRGGLLKPLVSGTYRVDQHMIDDLRIGVQGQHASNLGGVLAYGIGWDYGLPSFIVDPVAVDEFEPISRVTGIAELPRGSLFHALNIKATARRVAKDLGKPLSEMNLVVAHLGGGITIAAIRKGRIVDVNNGIGEGPFSPERSGAMHLPTIIDLCFSGKLTKQQVMRKIVGNAGLYSHFKTSSATEIEALIHAGNARARLVYEAMAYRIAQEIAGRCVTLSGEFDAIILTGGLAHSEMLTGWIEERCRFLGKVKRYPGENELQALAEGALRVLRGEEVAKTYDVQHKKIGIVYHQMTEAYEASIRTLESMLRDAGYRFRQNDETLEILSRSLKDRSPEAVTQELSTAGVDVVVTFGSPGAMAMKPFVKRSDTPTVCIACFDPVAMDLVDARANTGSNVTAASYRVPVAAQLHVLAGLVPDLKKVGVVYRSGELQSELQLDEVRQTCAGLGMTVLTCDAQSPSEFDAAAERFVAEGAEAAFLLSDSTSACADTATLAKLVGVLPTLGALDSTLPHGVLIGRVARWEEVTKKGSEMVLRILEGTRASSMPVFMECPAKTVLNMRTARKLGIKPGPELLSKVDEILFGDAD
jgi:butyrate kinase